MEDQHVKKSEKIDQDGLSSIAYWGANQKRHVGRIGNHDVYDVVMTFSSPENWPAGLLAFVVPCQLAVDTGQMLSNKPNTGLTSDHRTWQLVTWHQQIKKIHLKQSRKHWDIHSNPSSATSLWPHFANPSLSSWGAEMVLEKKPKEC